MSQPRATLPVVKVCSPHPGLRGSEVTRNIPVYLALGWPAKRDQENILLLPAEVESGFAR